MASDKFAAGDVLSMPAVVAPTVEACAKLSRELDTHCAKGEAGTVGVDCNVSPGAGQSAWRAWRNGDSDEEDEDDDVQRLERHVEQLWSLYCTVRETGC